MSIAGLGASSAYSIRPMTMSRTTSCAAGCGCGHCSSTQSSSQGSSSSSRQDTVEISPEAKARAEQEEAATSTDEPKAQNGKPLDEAQQKEVAKLKERDREVRTHEAAHLAAAGGHATGGASYTYQKGPDGKQYAVGGEVNVDTSEEKTPEATLRKMQAIQRAALAPAEPSGQDQAVANAAAQKASEARREIAAQRAAEAQAAVSGTGRTNIGRGNMLDLVA